MRQVPLSSFTNSAGCHIRTSILALGRLTVDKLCRRSNNLHDALTFDNILPRERLMLVQKIDSTIAQVKSGGAISLWASRLTFSPFRGH